jgi:hypothetical protein
MGFLRTLIIILLIYYIWRIVFRYIILPLFQKNSYATGNRQSHQRKARKREGETTIDFATGKRKIIGKDKGEYIDYEESKE